MRVRSASALAVVLCMGAGVRAHPQGITIRNGNTMRAVVVAGDRIAIPITVDFSGYTSVGVTGLTTGVTWDPARLGFDSAKAGGLYISVNGTAAATGSLSISMNSAYFTETSILATVYFTAKSSGGGTRVSLSPTVAFDKNYKNILPDARVQSLDVCVGKRTLWGDANADHAITIVDAQQIARFSVGLAVLDSIAVADQGDVTADGYVSIIDAQQIARYSVSLSAAQRVNTPGVVTPLVTRVELDRTSLVIGVNAFSQLLVTPRGQGGVALYGCHPVAWNSSVASVARVDSTGRVSGTVTGSTTVSATVEGVVAGSAVAVSEMPAPITLVSGGDQVQASNVRFIEPIVVSVKDAQNRAVQGARVIFAVTGGGGKLPTFNPDVATTDVNGNASVVWQPGFETTHTLAATVSGLPDLAISARTARDAGVFNCALSAAEAAYCWGPLRTGALYVPTPVGGGMTFRSLAAGAGGHRCAPSPVGHAYCWGANDYGQLGDGTTIDRDTPVAVVGGHTFVQLSVSANATCGLSSSGALSCWGSEGYGLFGDGKRGGIRSTATAVNTGDVSFVSMSISSATYCGLSTTQRVYCWGHGEYGQVGDGALLNRATPTPIAGSRSYIAVSTGAVSSCALDVTGKAFCWGANLITFEGTSTGRFDAPLALPGDLTFASIASGNDGNGCALTLEGRAYCWGLAGGGSVGDGTRESRRAPTRVLGDLTFTSLSIGDGTTCARATSGHPYCWGNSLEGQVGDGSGATRSVPTAVNWMEGQVGVPVSVTAAGTSNWGYAGKAIGEPPSVTIRDYTGAPVSGVTVVFAAIAGSGTVTGGTAVSNAKGIATAGGWVLGLPGENKVIVTAPSLPGFVLSAHAYSP
ncbi:MAG: Ig-like domain-containing protein [Gemmatimonadota bacterium]